MRENTLPCIYRGREVGIIQCDSCAGKVFIKLYRCEKFGTCSIEKKIGELPDCKTCEHHDPIPKKGIAAELEPPFEKPPKSVVEPMRLKLAGYSELESAILNVAQPLQISFNSHAESERILDCLTRHGFSKQVIRDYPPGDPLYLERGCILSEREL